MAAAEVIFCAASRRQPKTSVGAERIEPGDDPDVAALFAVMQQRPERAARFIRDRGPAQSLPRRALRALRRARGCTRSTRNTLTARDHHDMSGGPQDVVDRGGHRLPSRCLGRELLSAGGGQFVHARPASGVLRDPLRANPPGLLHAVERRVERSFFDAEHIARAWPGSRSSARSRAGAAAATESSAGADRARLAGNRLWPYSES